MVSGIRVLKYWVLGPSGIVILLGSSRDVLGGQNLPEGEASGGYGAWHEVYMGKLGGLAKPTENLSRPAKEWGWPIEDYQVLIGPMGIYSGLIGL